MLGRLTYDSLPFYSIIAFGGAAITVGAGLAIDRADHLVRLWGWLWKNYLTTLDHKRIGIMYIVVALVMLVRGFIDALMMRGQQMASARGTVFWKATISSRCSRRMARS
jgi:cytochrome o ubiquinol oxidase subunit 1